MRTLELATLMATTAIVVPGATGSEPYPAPPLSAFCPSCPYNVTAAAQHANTTCAERVAFLVEEYYQPETQAILDLLERWKCVDPNLERPPPTPPPTPNPAAAAAAVVTHESKVDCRNPADGCNWWVNPLKAEGCATGPNVPPGRYDVYGTREHCCHTNFPSSETCNVEHSVVYYPATISSNEEETHEAIAFQFRVRGLSQSVVENAMGEVKQEMRLVLKRTLLRLSYGVPGLQIAAVVEKKREMKEDDAAEGDSSTGGEDEQTRQRRGLRRTLGRSMGTYSRRQLAQDNGGVVTVHYDVYVAREAGRAFGPVLVSELRDSYDEVLEQIRSFPDTKYLNGEGVDLNWCTFDDEGIAHCVRAVVDDAASITTGTPTSSTVPSASPTLTGRPTATSTDAPAGIINIFPLPTNIGIFALGPSTSLDDASAKHDIFESVPLQFAAVGLPSTIQYPTTELRSEMLTIVKRILLQLATDIEGMIFVSVEEGTVDFAAMDAGGAAIVRYDVTVMRDEGKKFGALIVDELRDAYDDAIDRIHKYTTTYITEDVVLNWCTSDDSSDESFSHCAREALFDFPIPTEVEPPVGTPSPIAPGPSSEPTAATTYTNTSTNETTASSPPSHGPTASPDNGLSATVPGSACEAPFGGCGNGIYNPSQCECECIRPYCPNDTDGRCFDANKSGGCGGNPWAQCLRGVDCPWFADPLKEGSCTTGPYVPPGQWNIYTDLLACCEANFPQSHLCASEGSVVYYPTVAPPDVHEAVPIRFNVAGIPSNFTENEREELREDTMMTVLEQILRMLTERIPELRIPHVEERRGPTPFAVAAEGVTVYYDVYVVKDDETEFGPMIINELRETSDDVIEQIQALADTPYLGEGLDLSFCAFENGEYTNCAEMTLDSEEEVLDYTTSQVSSDILATEPTSSPLPTSKETATPSNEEAVRPSAGPAAAPGSSFPTPFYTPFPTAGFGQTATPTSASPAATASPGNEQSSHPTGNNPTTLPTSQQSPDQYESKEPTQGPTYPSNAIGRDGPYYPNFASGLCLNDGRFPQDVSDKYLFDNASSCCNAFFRTNIQDCMSAKAPTPSPTLPLGDKVWYPDYENDICKNDGQHGPFEINFFASYESCCRFEWINTGKCLQALFESNQPKEVVEVEAEAPSSSGTWAIATLTPPLVVALVMFVV